MPQTYDHPEAFVAEIQVGDVRLHVATLGAGSPLVVFVHGLVMDNLSSWYFAAAPRVAVHRRVLCYDLRGHGRSTRPHTGYRVDDHLADLAGLLNAVSPEAPVILVGNSFGGHLAAAFAARWPERVAGLALVDAELGGEGFGERMAATLSLEGEARDATIGRLFQDWLGRRSERKSAKLRESASALVHGTTLVADLRASPPIADAHLARITAPVLALYGERSDLIAEVDRLRAVLPHADVRVFPGCTHSLMWEANEEMVAAIVGFTGPAGPVRDGNAT